MPYFINAVFFIFGILLTSVSLNVFIVIDFIDDAFETGNCAPYGIYLDQFILLSHLQNEIILCPKNPSLETGLC